MAASFRTLRNHGIGAVLLEPDRFLHRRRRGDHETAGRLDPLEQRLIRQSEMEADDLRLQLLDDLAETRIERRAVRRIVRCGRIEAKFLVIARRRVFQRASAAAWSTTGVWQKKFMLTGAGRAGG